MSRPPLPLTIAVLVLGAGVARGQQADPAVLPPPDLDPAAERALWAWEALEYRPVELGLRGGSFTVKMHLTGQGEQKGSARYEWQLDDSKSESRLTWDPRSLGERLSREGWSKERFDLEYLHLDARLPYSGCSLVGHTAEEGAVWIEIRGNSPSGIKELHFDREGVLARQVYEVDSGFGSKMRFNLRPRYRRLEDGRFVKVGEQFEMKAPFGAIQSISTIELQQIEGVFVPKTMTETSTYNGEASGENRFEYVDWKIERVKEKGAARSGSW